MNKQILFTIILLFTCLTALWAQDIAVEENFRDNPAQLEAEEDYIKGSLLLFTMGLVVESGDLPYFIVGGGMDLKLTGTFALEGNFQIMPSSADSSVNGSESSTSIGNNILAMEGDLLVKYAINKNFWTAGGFTYRTLFDSYYSYKESLGMPLIDSPPENEWIIRFSGGYNKSLTLNTMSIYSLSLGYKLNTPNSPWAIGFHYTTSTRAITVVKKIKGFFTRVRKSKNPS